MESLNPLSNNVKTIMEKKDILPITEIKNSKQVENDVEAEIPQLISSEPSHISDYNQSITRNMSFKLNSESNEMYVEITNSDDEIVKVIPVDKNDPRFIELLSNSNPGMIIDSKL